MPRLAIWKINLKQFCSFLLVTNWIFLMKNISENQTFHNIINPSTYQTWRSIITFLMCDYSLICTCKVLFFKFQSFYFRKLRVMKLAIPLCVTESFSMNLIWYVFLSTNEKFHHWILFHVVRRNVSGSKVFVLELLSRFIDFVFIIMPFWTRSLEKAYVYRVVTFQLSLQPVCKFLISFRHFKVHYIMHFEYCTNLISLWAIFSTICNL